MVVILAAALIPFLVGLNVPKWTIGGLGVLIAVIEGLQQLNRILRIGLPTGPHAKP